MDSFESIPRQALLAHEDFVRKLATRLVRDPNDADDIAQETWLALLRRSVAPSALAGLVRGLTWTHRRSSQRRAARERVSAAHEATESADELAARLEIQQLVVETVLALGEPYRSVVLLRFYRDLTPTEIAARLDLPLETVKTRLRRGLAQLREALDRRHGDDGRSWLAALAPFVPNASLTVATGAAVVKTKVAVVSALAALLFIGGLLWTIAITKRAPAREPVVESASLATPATAPTDALPVASVATSDDSARAEAAEAPTVAAGPRILVVEESTRAPVAGAEVWFARWREFIPRQRADPDPRDDLPAKGQKLVTDAAGSIQLPRIDEVVFVGCSHAGLWGDMHVVGSTSDTHTLVLSRDRALAVLVVDESGAPATGVAVGLRVRGERWEDLVLESRTGDDGMAVFRHVDHALKDSLTPGRWLFATLLAVTAEPVEVGIDPKEFPAQAVRLTLPTTARVVVDVEDEHGEPFTEGTWVSLTPLLARLGGGVDFAERESLYTEEARITFEHVALGLNLRVDAGLWGRRPAVIEAKGPTTAGEEAHITIEVGTPYPIVTGRALDANGQPLADRKLMRAAHLRWGETERTDRNPVSTDAEGRFRSTINTADGVETSATLEFVSEGDQPPVLGAQVELPRAVLSGEIELGDIRLEPEPLIVSGTVVDASGAPVYWAQVDVAHRTSKADEPPRWEWLNQFQSMTAQDGTFQLHGRLPAGECALVCQKVDYLSSEYTSFRAGTTGLQIVLRQHGTLAGSVLVDSDIPPNWLHVEVVSRGSDPPTGKTEQVHADAGFVVSGLVPGSADVFLALDRFSPRLVHIENVSVAGGDATSDPRLQAIDLRGKLRRIDVDVEGASGEVVDEGYVAYVPSGETGEPRHVLIAAGRASLLTLATSMDIEVVGAGYRSASLKGVSTSTRVHLDRGILVRVRLPEDVPLPPPPAQLTLALVGESGATPVWLHSQDGSGSMLQSQWARTAAVAFDDAREVAIPVAAAGRYRPEWRLRTRGERASSFPVLALQNQSEVQIDDGGRELALAPDLESLHEATEARR